MTQKELDELKSRAENEFPDYIHKAFGIPKEDILITVDGTIITATVRFDMLNLPQPK